MVDLDGTLADTTERALWAQQKDWDRFHENHMASPVIVPVRELVEAWRCALPGHRVCILTGRPERFRKSTQEWLVMHGISCDLLLMRPDDNHQTDAIVKPALLFQYLPNGFHDVAFVVDDRDRVVARWRELGLTCFQPAPGAY